VLGCGDARGSDERASNAVVATKRQHSGGEPTKPAARRLRTQPYRDVTAFGQESARSHEEEEHPEQPDDHPLDRVDEPRIAESGEEGRDLEHEDRHD
jgi:hypothetical protein